MTQDQIDQARVLGAGNLSRGVRVAIQVASAVKSVEGHLCMNEPQSTQTTTALGK